MTHFTSLVTAALVAAFVGYGASVAIILAAAQALAASAEQTIAWVAAVSIAKGVTMAGLSAWTRMPVVLAWSTPGAALIAASEGLTIDVAVGAFLVCGALLTLTGALPALNRLVAGIPTGIAAAMLAGVLLPFCMAVADHGVAAPALVAPIAVTFLAVRLVSPLYAPIAALFVGLVAALVLTDVRLPKVALDIVAFSPIVPTWDWSVMLGLGVPLYLVTMAGQNLPGFAVMQANGYAPPARMALLATGVGSSAIAVLGAHPYNMAAITAALCIGPEAHPDPERRWRVGVIQGALWVVIGLATPVIVPVMLALPEAVILAVAGLALLAPLMGALAQAFQGEETRFAAAVTFVTTASGVAFFGIGAAFWGLILGVLVHLGERTRTPVRTA